ncbi:MAG: hypothetical protein M9920_15670 [Verrucomicrobiae bacterium]|nr:hypothetical protein [Verrucomicrobiae bacterium]
MNTKSLLISLGVVSISGSLIGQTIFSDDYQSYNDTSALSGTYTQMYPDAPVLLDTEKGYNSSQSIHFGTPSANSLERMWFNLPGGPVAPTDAAPLLVEFMVDLDVDIWSTRQYIELRSYANGAYNDGALNQLLALGFNSSGVNTALINKRIYAGNDAGWGDLTGNIATRASIVAASDWTKLGMLIKGDTVEWYVNGLFDSANSITANVAYDSIVIGSGLSSAGADVWFDNLTVTVIPEPTTMALGLIGGISLLLARKTRRQ